MSDVDNTTKEEKTPLQKLIDTFIFVLICTSNLLSMVSSITLIVCGSITISNPQQSVISSCSIALIVVGSIHIDIVGLSLGSILLIFIVSCLRRNMKTDDQKDMNNLCTLLYNCTIVLSSLKAPITCVVTGVYFSISNVQAVAIDLIITLYICLPVILLVLLLTCCLAALIGLQASETILSETKTDSKEQV